ncbi:hypothetical protein [Providencia phage PSTCR6]|nr:hypothetical protein [Providencia phage PSTCR6]
MVKTNKAFLHLCELKPFSMEFNRRFLDKARSTIEYAKSMDPSRDVKDIIDVTIPAIMAEYYIAEYMDGTVNEGEENLEDPMTYGFDVLSGAKYNGARIEVKCSFSGKWINVCGGVYGGTKGINLGTFLTHQIADLIIILSVSKKSKGAYKFTPRVISDHEAFIPEHNFVLKSKYNDSYYLNTKNYPKDCTLKVC